MNIEITKAALKHKDDKKALIYWESNVGYGYLRITYNGDGSYNIDAEFMSLDTVIKILQKVNLEAPNFKS